MLTARPAHMVTFLEMERPGVSSPKPALNIQSASPLPQSEFLDLYQETGRDYFWTDWLEATPAKLAAYCEDPRKSLHVLYENGERQGFFVIKADERASEISYFGLLPAAIGRGLGGALLDYAIATIWERMECEILRLNTCTLDHERALSLYRSRGFVITHREWRPERNIRAGKGLDLEAPK